MSKFNCIGIEFGEISTESMSVYKMKMIMIYVSMIFVDYEYCTV